MIGYIVCTRDIENIRKITIFETKWMNEDGLNWIFSDYISLLYLNVFSFVEGNYSSDIKELIIF